VVYVCLFDVRLLEDDLKKIETCRRISEFMSKCIINTCAFIGIIYVLNFSLTF